MNKLVIVGNGFDLAHGLPTSYEDFIDDFWKNLIQTYDQNHIQDMVFVNPKYEGLISRSIENFDDLLRNLVSESNSYRYNFDKARMKITAKNGYGENIVAFEIKNRFFKQINVSKSISNWVDIENEYYQSLKFIFKLNKEEPGEASKAINRLNIEFEQVKKLLEKYLLKNVHEAFNLKKFKSRNWVSLHNYLRPISLYNNELKIFKEFQKSEDKDYLENLFESEKNDDGRYSDTYILNFNYTLTTSQYLFDIYNVEYSEKINHIHGILGNKLDNQLNFGFGDEMDDDYRMIENLNKNEYLQNFKSFKYLQNSNYQNLLRIIESGKFQVLIMGHSCGLSDRTLLNTIFEHENCRSIKVFYHQKEDGSDNFTEIVQNISRHFNDKKVMREKIVNKSLCQHLPQDIRFQEKQ